MKHVTTVKDLLINNYEQVKKQGQQERLIPWTLLNGDPVKFTLYDEKIK